MFAKVYEALVEGGRFVFSIEPPVITSCDRAWQTPGPRQDWSSTRFENRGLSGHDFARKPPMSDANAFH